MMDGMLRQIRPCDRDRPFLFISYSAKDGDAALADALELQRRGFNLWLDEKNLDKTKPSWKEDALEAIEDMDCSLVLFYAGRHSLCSENCHREIEHTASEAAQGSHFGIVPFLVVEAEPIDDIVCFAQRLFESIRGGDLPKEEKQRQCRVLRRFVTEQFHSNNERVRIRFRNAYDTAEDYYGALIAQLPAEARNLRPEEPRKEEPRKEEPRKEEMPAQPGGPAGAPPRRAAAAGSSEQRLLAFASMISSAVSESEYVNPYLSDDMADIIARSAESVSLYTAERCLDEDINPVVFEVFLAQKIARINDPASCAGSFRLIHSMPGNWRVFLNDQKKIVAYWVFIALKEDAYRSITGGRVNEQDIGLEDARFIDMPGVYKGYLLICGTIAQHRTPRIVNMLYSSWLGAVQELAENGILFDEIASMVGSVAGNSSLQNIGMQPYADYRFGGKIYKYPMQRAWEIGFLRKNYPKLCEIYRKEFAP